MWMNGIAIAVSLNKGVEQRLVEIMEQCWEIDFEKRVSIFDVVRQLDDLQKWHAAELERPHAHIQ
jgi:hypothetical protein